MDITNNWEWGSHQPLVNLALYTFRPELVVELGIGLYSTPLFLKYNPTALICIENNKEWLEYTKTQLLFRPEYELRYHELSPEVTLFTRARVLEAKNRVAHFEYYLTVRDEINQTSYTPRLLFVDNFTCLRALAVNVLNSAFDIILYHDSQLEGIAMYNYNFEHLSSEFNFYTFHCSFSWTTCLVRKTLIYDEEKLFRDIQPFSEEFCAIYKRNIHELVLLKG